MTIPTIDPARLEANWHAITAELDAPRPRLLERVLHRCGVGEPTARLMVSTPALRRAWFVAMGLAILFALGSAGGGDTGNGFVVFLALAPLVPTIGVALAYGPGSDPAHEVTLATPLSGLRLVLTRAVAVFAASIPILLLTAAALPDVEWYGIAWLLPALACSGVCLALTTVFTPRRAGAAVTFAWLALVVVADARTGDALVLFGMVGQAAAVATALVALGAVLARRTRFDLLHEAA